MSRIPIIASLVMLALFCAMPADADRLSAIEIYDGMIHYESDQLATSPNINDYHCKVTEITTRTAVDTNDVVEKDLYFMAPTFQLQMVDDEPMYYFDDDLMIVFLESMELERERDAEIDGVACYVIRTTPKDPAFAMYNRLYYIAQEDFRKVRTVATHSTRQYENLVTTINYTYGQVDGFTLLIGTTSEVRDANGNLIATVRTEYTDYEFGLGLDIEFFSEKLAGWRPNPSLN